MKKFILMLITSIIFVSCVPAKKVMVISSNGIESDASFEDFFDYEIIVRDNDNNLIIMDKNTEVLYIMNDHYGISPIYDSDGTIMTKEKWLAKRAKKEEENEERKD